ncbi:hypothetical protein Zmor_008667 [Zophobas morio]|uniref:ABC3 transporter permease C-terminal domain-containing protein n=1 Tax=Zophobas morio TaxID=2755281 RepID=A0AA38HK40_9CUCU|nr:hypothetical protein Zmor_008667 [Zophobas morio]
MKNVPTIDVIVPKRERKYFKKHNQIVLTLVEDQKTNYRLYIPLYFNVLDYDVVIPTDEVVVSEQQLKSAVDELVDGVKDGLQTYEKQNAETNYKIFNDIFSEDFKFTLEYNTFFGNGVPRGYSNLVFSANGDPSKFESYGLSESVLNDYPVSIDDFASIGHAALNNLGPVLAIIKNITVFAFFIAVLVSILLIYLILKENNNIIAVLKIMGYRKRSITGYIITGYIISSVLASAAAVGVSFAGFGISAVAIENMFSYTFAIHINTAYIMTLITSPIAYLVIV